MLNKKFYGGVEAGGTKFVCGIGTGNGELLDRVEIKTTSPIDTLGQVVEFFGMYPQIHSIGVGSFGPLQINKKAHNYGEILNTPKPGWAKTNIPKYLSTHLGLPIVLATDTDVAAVGEHHHGKALGLNSFVYLTVGTGIGGSIVQSGRLLHGISHPEIGHSRIPIITNSFGGTCEYHGNCFEGLASGKSLEIQTGQKAEHITDPNIWRRESQNIALGLINTISICQPQMIILGGSVMKRPHLIGSIREDVKYFINNYFSIPKIESYIVHASSDTIGVLGAIKLASLENQQ